MKENIKIGLLALIAVTLIINTFQDSNPSSSEPGTATVEATSNAATANTNAIQPNPPVVDNRPKTTASWGKVEHDFGNVDQDSQNKHVFKFRNSGEEPLVISNAKGSCGCTVPNYPREPIAPGEFGEIEVVYSPGKQQNQQTKTVTITANTEPETMILRIKANVLVPEGTEEG